MRHVTSEQEKLLNQLRALDPRLEVRWDNVRGVASFVRGKLQPSPAKGNSESSLEHRLGSFLREYGALFGPPDLSPEALMPLQWSKDDLGWTHLVLQHKVQVRDEEAFEVYGAKLAAHFDAQGALIEVQSSLWRDIRASADVRVSPQDVRAVQLKRLENIQGFAGLRDRLEKEEKLFPLTHPPRLVIYPWNGDFPLAWATYGFGVSEKTMRDEGEGGSVIVHGHLFVDASTGEQILFAPTVKHGETHFVGHGLAVTPLTGPRTKRDLNTVCVDNSSTYRLKDIMHNRNIVTYDTACNPLYVPHADIAAAIKNGTMPVSENIGPEWNRVPGIIVARADAQPPEVDAHYFVQQQYEWYNALAGPDGRAGWDDGKYTNPPVPNQVLNVLVHCYGPDEFGSQENTELHDGVFTTWLEFKDGNDVHYDYPAGSRFVVAHEYQHAITDFSFKDGGGNPCIPYKGWLAAVHEGLSDVFAGLSSEDWLPCQDISHDTPPQILQNLVFPAESFALDHWDQRNNTTDGHARGAILAHCAYFLAKGGVHERMMRNPPHIPVYGLGRASVSGKDFYKAARIWYRALTVYSSTIGGLTGLSPADESAFRTLRDGCVKAAEDLYGHSSPERLNTILAFYAVGLHPPDENYGPDVTFLRWGIDWDLSRNYILALSSPDYSSRDLFINNDGISEWNAVVNVVDPMTGKETEYENTIYCRVRNIGDQPAENVVVDFEFAKAGTAVLLWDSVRDKDKTPAKLFIGTLGPGQSNFSDLPKDQNKPPASAGVKWCIPALATGEEVSHFCLKAKVTASNDVNPYNNEVQSNIAYIPYSLSAKHAFVVGNPFKEERILVELKVKAELPKGWKANILEDFKKTWLRPGEERLFTVAIEMLPKADVELQMPLDGDLQGHLYGDVSGPFTGSLTDAALVGHELRGRLAATLPHLGTVVGLFRGSIDLHTGEVSGKVIGSASYRKVPERIHLGIEACLRPWRRVEISQWHGTDLIGGVTVQVQVPWEKGPCAWKLPPTGTKATPAILATRLTS